MLTLRKISFLFPLSLLLAACVTINVYFPAAAAEKAADQIIEKVLRSEEQSKEQEQSEEQPKGKLRTLQQTTPRQSSATDEADEIWGPEPTTPTNEADEIWDPEPEPSSSLDDTKPSLNAFTPTPLPSRWLTHWLNLLLSPVYGEINFDISSPAIQVLLEKMGERHKKLKRGYDIGAIGLTHDGLIALRDVNKVPLKSRRKVKAWMEEENQDRLDLYHQIATANGRPQWAIQIRQTFAERWIEHAEPGWWYQDKEGKWQRKPIEK